MPAHSARSAPSRRRPARSRAFFVRERCCDGGASLAPRSSRYSLRWCPNPLLSPRRAKPRAFHVAAPRLTKRVLQTVGPLPYYSTCQRALLLRNSDARCTQGSDVSALNWGSYTAKHREYCVRHSVDVGVWHHSGRRFAAVVIAGG